jgi:hypothetical protein
MEKISIKSYYVLMFNMIWQSAKELFILEKIKI